MTEQVVTDDHFTQMQTTLLSGSIDHTLVIGPVMPDIRAFQIGSRDSNGVRLDVIRAVKNDIKAEDIRINIAIRLINQGGWTIHLMENELEAAALMAMFWPCKATKSLHQEAKTKELRTKQSPHKMGAK